MTTGVIDVGGGLRGIYGAGVFDYLIDQDVKFDYCIGISAGSANIASYMAGQKGRNFVYYTEYAFRKEYMGFREFLRHHNYINMDYIYSTLSDQDGEYPLDYDKIAASGMPYRIVATDAETGEAVYFTEKDVWQDHYDVIKASCSVPVVNQPYIVNGREYFDGGLSDPIPIRKAFEEGCDKVVVILTRPRDFYRTGDKDKRMAKFFSRKYPKAAEDLVRRGDVYNWELDQALKGEKEGRVLVVAPSDISGMKTLNRNKKAIEKLYHAGYRDARTIPEFVKGNS